MQRHVLVGAGRIGRLVGLALVTLTPAVFGQTYEWVTFVGSRFERGSADGGPDVARFNAPHGIAVDAEGVLYVADYGNDIVRKVTPDGLVTTLAGQAGVYGHADGAGRVARFYRPRGIALDADRNAYVADSVNNVVRKITPAGVVSTIAGIPGVAGFVNGTAAEAKFDRPVGVAVDRAGNVFVSDNNNRVLRKITPSGVVTTWAGSANSPGTLVDGIRIPGPFSSPSGLAIDARQNVYVGDFVVWSISPEGAPTVLRPSMPYVASYLLTSRIGTSSAITVDASGVLYIADFSGSAVLRLDERELTTIGGGNFNDGASDGFGYFAGFQGPSGIAVDAVGNLYVSEQGNHRIRKGTQVAAPVLAAGPSTLSPEPGGAASLSVLVAGMMGTTLQWYLDDQPVIRATSRTLVLPNVQPGDQGTYAVVATNRLGSNRVVVGVLALRQPPLITVQPQPGTLSAGGPALSVSASGTAPLHYQWLRDDAPVAGAISASFVPNLPGAYAVRVTNAYGTVTSATAQVRAGARLANLATRTLVRPGDPLVAGFVVRGTGGTRKQLLVRGIGPALAAFGVEPVAGRIRVSVLQAGQVRATNTGWDSAPNAADIAAVARAVGAFALAAGSADSALLVDLEPGPYTVEVATSEQRGGAVMAEVYERDGDGAYLLNLSARGHVGPLEPLAAGIVITGGSTARVLLRGIGPGLRSFGIDDALAAPVLTVYRSGERIATNQGWSRLPDRDALVAAMAAAGAFPLEPDSGDAALLLTLAPGNYTAEISIDGQAAGSALVEVYRLE